MDQKLIDDWTTPRERRTLSREALWQIAVDRSAQPVIIDRVVPAPPRT